MNISIICTFLKPKFRRSKALARLEFYSDSLMFGSRLSTYTTQLIRLPTQLGNQATINLLFKSQQFCPKNLGWQKQKKTILSVGYLNCSAAQMLLPITNLEDPFRTSLEVFFKKNIKSYNKFLGKCLCRIISEKAAWQTELETLSALLCAKDSKSNHEQKQASQVFIAKVTVMLKI